jgi:HK97 family phage major capsid protein
MSAIAQKLTALRQQYAAANARLQTLNAGELTDDTLAQMRSVDEELKGIKAQIDSLTPLADSVAEGQRNAGVMGMQFNTDSRHELNDSLRQMGAGEVLGFARRGDEGVAHIYERGGQRFVELEGGVGIMTEKQFKALSEPAYEQAFRAYLQSGGKMDRVDSHDRRVLEVGDDTAGGFLVPADYQRRILERKPAPTRLRANVSVINTGSDTVILPRVNYEGSDKHIWPNGMRVTWTGESPASSTAHRVTQPTFGQTSIPVGTAMLSQPMTLNFLEDSFMDPLGWLADRFGMAVELTEESEIVIGPGTEGRMHGIMTAPDTDGQIASVVSGHASLLTADGLINLAYELPEQYDDNSRFYFNKRNVEKYIATLKDDVERYLFATGSQDDKLASARPKELLGYPISRVAFMPDMAANAFPVLFGDATGYTLVRRVGFSIKLLTETYYEQNQLVAVGRLRIGGKTTEAWTMLAQKCST